MTSKTIFFLALFLSLTSCARLHQRPTPNIGIKDFTTDGCTLFPDHSLIVHEQSWKHCCIAHDMEYWIGGTSEQKEVADEELKQCVAQVKDEALGTMMKLAVTLGGRPSSANWAWGYGHPAPFDYQKLGSEQKKDIALKLHTILLEYLLLKHELTDSQMNYLLDRFDHRLNSDYKNYISYRQQKIINALKLYGLQTTSQPTKLGPLPQSPRKQSE